MTAGMAECLPSAGRCAESFTAELLTGAEALGWCRFSPIDPRGKRCGKMK